MYLVFYKYNALHELFTRESRSFLDISVSLITPNEEEHIVTIGDRFGARMKEYILKVI